MPGTEDAWHDLGNVRTFKTASTPGMTFVTAPGRDPAPYRAALAEAASALPAWAREATGMIGVTVLPPEAYERPLPPEPVLSAA